MNTNVILDSHNGTRLTLQAPAIHGQATDFILDHESRRRSQGGHRRALVHDESDGLTVNFANDYPGGLTLNNVASITPKKAKREGPPDETGAVGVRSVAELKVVGGIRFVWDRGDGLAAMGRRHEEVSLQSLIETLQQQVAALSDRLARLER
jgi:hypothetical protein